jgi:trans-aconitate 2-methyltransferase
VSRYTFGDDQPAVQRLSLVAEAYEPVSRAVLDQHVPPGAPVVVDAGCGPGFSTALIADVCRPTSLVGLDASEAFLRSARERLPAAQFVRHDVTVMPFPTPPANVIYARLVLAHLGDPAGILDRWCQHLAPGGVVVSEELEGIEAPAGPLRDYDDLSSAMVRRGGGVMCAGPLLAHLGGRCLPVVASAALAARIYSFNVRLWREQGDTGMADDDLARLELALADVVRRDDDHTVAWIVRQTVLSPGTPTP